MKEFIVFMAILTGSETMKILLMNTILAIGKLAKFFKKWFIQNIIKNI